FQTGPRKPRGHEERETASAGSAVPRNDVGVTPLHDPRTERVLELGRVNEECLRSGLFSLSGEEAEGRHETTVRHGPGRREPPQLEDVRVIDDHAPLILCHRASCILRADSLRSSWTIWYKLMSEVIQSSGREQVQTEQSL